MSTSRIFLHRNVKICCLLESEGIDNLASLDSLDSLLEQEFPEVHLIHLEIRYQKVVVNDHTTNKDLYRRWYVDKKTGKRVYFSLNDRITFLKKSLP